jgi:hypothetical protein
MTDSMKDVKLYCRVSVLVTNWNQANRHRCQKIANLIPVTYKIPVIKYNVANMVVFFNELYFWKHKVH